MTPRGARAPAVWFVLIVLAFDALCVGLVVPIVPELVRRLSGGSVGAASLWLGALVATFALAQLIGAPILGGLSDRYGRRAVILLSLAGAVSNYLLLAWAPTLGWLYLGRALAGFSAGNMSAATAYIADVTPPKERARRFGLVGAMFSLGFVLGPAVGGLLGRLDLRLPFLAAAGLALANVLYGVFLLPESLPRERRRPFTWRGANSFAALYLLASDRILRRLGLCWGCLWFAIGTLQTTFVLSTSIRFGWGPERNGLALAMVGVCGALVQGFLVRRVVARLGERRTAVVGFALGACAYLLLGAATRPWMAVAALVLQSCSFMANPAVRAMVSARAGPERQGQVMGSLSAVEGLTAILTPLVAASLLRAFSGPGAVAVLPGAPFLGSAVVFLVAMSAVATTGPARPAVAARLTS
jgi:DHA1 family tetracycline resistance protein-like MFS transporter